MRARRPGRRLLGCSGLIVAAVLLGWFLVHSWLGGWGGPHSAQLRAINAMRWSSSLLRVRYHLSELVSDPNEVNFTVFGWTLQSFEAPYKNVSAVDELMVSEEIVDLAKGLPSLRKLQFLTTSGKLPPEVLALTSLRSLHFISESTGSVALAGLERLNGLEELFVGAETIDFSSVPPSPTLKELSVVRGTTSAYSPPVPELSAFPCMRVLLVWGLGGSRNLGFLEDLHDLNRVTLMYGQAIESLQGIEFCSLRRLNLSDFPKLTELTSLGGQTGITKLTLRRLPLAEDFTFLSELVELEQFSVSQCGIRSLTPLQDHPRLSSLKIHDCPQLTDYSALGTLQLQEIRINGKEYTDAQAALDDLTSSSRHR